MSRSFKKNNFSGNTTADSDKYDKEKHHRARRKTEKNVLSSLNRINLEDLEDSDFLDLEFEKEVNDGLSLFSKDGKTMFYEDDFPELKRK